MVRGIREGSPFLSAGRRITLKKIQNNFVTVYLLLKGNEDGALMTKITPTMLGELAEKISREGHSHVQTTGGNYVAVGFMGDSKEVGERVIVIDSWKDKELIMS